MWSIPWSCSWRQSAEEAPALPPAWIFQSTLNANSQQLESTVAACASSKTIPPPSHPPPLRMRGIVLHIWAFLLLSLVSSEHDVDAEKAQIITFNYDCCKIITKFVIFRIHLQAIIVPHQHYFVNSCRSCVVQQPLTLSFLCSFFWSPAKRWVTLE